MSSTAFLQHICFRTEFWTELAHSQTFFRSLFSSCLSPLLFFLYKDTLQDSFFSLCILSVGNIFGLQRRQFINVYDFHCSFHCGHWLSFKREKKELFLAAFGILIRSYSHSHIEESGSLLKALSILSCLNNGSTRDIHLFINLISPDQVRNSPLRVSVAP